MTAAVVIGRNEGARLLRCLDTLAGQVDRVVYVDSGSTDGSVAAAEARGALVVRLDMTRPFTAARARNAGFDALRGAGLPEFVQFVDGDCAVVPGWIDSASATLRADPTLGMVTGWRSELHPEVSIYNRMCDVEWHRPAGPITACGGDMMLRAAAWDAVGGMDPAIPASEDEELCLRLAAAGWGLLRLPHPMTRHDAAILTFGQWWQRAVRTGHGFGQIGQRHPAHFRTERLRVWFYGLALPVLALLCVFFAPVLLLAVAALYALSGVKAAQGLRRSHGLGAREAAHQGLLLTLSKFPNLIGMARYGLRRLSGRAMRIIEYK